MPSSVDASAATGMTGRPSLDQWRDVRVEVVPGPADRDDRGTGLGDHPGDRRADAAAAGAGHHDDPAGQAQEIGAHNRFRNCPDKRVACTRWRTSFYSS